MELAYIYLAWQEEQQHDEMIAATLLHPASTEMTLIENDRPSNHPSSNPIESLLDRAKVQEPDVEFDAHPCPSYFCF